MTNERERRFVLCLNDFPIGVYISQEKAEKAATTHKATAARLNGGKTSPMTFYHTHEFTTDRRVS